MFRLPPQTFDATSDGCQSLGVPIRSRLFSAPMRLALLMLVPRVPNCANSGHCGSGKPALLMPAVTTVTAVTPIEYEQRSRVVLALQEEIGARDVAAIAQGFGSRSSAEPRAERAEVVLAAVRQDGTALRLQASAELLADSEVVLAAVRQEFSATSRAPVSSVEAVQFAFEDLQVDRKVVPAAVQQRGSALQFASGELQVDRETLTTGLVDTDDGDEDAELDEAADPNGLTDLPMLLPRYLWLVLRYLRLVLSAVLQRLESRDGIISLDEGMHRVVLAEEALVEVQLLRGRLLHLVRVKDSCSERAE